MLSVRRLESRPDDGFTLIELIISIGLLGVVFSVLSMVMIGAFSANKETEVRLDETRDEQFVAAYFANDVAGATEMVSAVPAASCGMGPAFLEFRGSSFDASSLPNPTQTAVSYVFATTGTITRYACEEPASSPIGYPWSPAKTTVVARNLAAAPPAVVCSTGATVAPCSTATTTLNVTFARRSGGHPFVLSGTRRTTP